MEFYVTKIPWREDRVFFDERSAKISISNLIPKEHIHNCKIELYLWEHLADYIGMNIKWAKKYHLVAK